MRRKEERSKQGQTNNKAKQHNTPKAVTFPKINELPRVGLYMFAAVYSATCTCTGIYIYTQEQHVYSMYNNTHRSNMYTTCTAIHTGATCIQHVYNSMSYCILCDFVYHGFLPSSSLINIYNVHVSIHVVYSKFFLVGYFYLFLYNFISKTYTQTLFC